MMYSPVLVSGIQYMTKHKNSKNSRKRNKQQNRQPVAYSEAPARAFAPAPPQYQQSALGRLGGALGNGLSDFFSGKLFGSGAYKLAGGNTSWDTTNQVPSMHSSADSIILSHKEYIGDVSSSTAFTTQFTLDINAGNESTFPYLAGIASAFQEYRFKGLVFEFKSTSADALNSTNTALGTIGLVCNYRSDKPLATTKVEAANEMWSVDTKPSLNAYLPVECNPKETPMNVAYIGYPPTTADSKFYDLGRLQVYSVGSQAAAVVGELWATYEVELMKPCLSSSSQFFRSSRSAVSTGSPLGDTEYTIQTIGGLKPTITAGGAVTWQTTPGEQYFFNVGYASGTSTAMTITTATGVSALNIFNTDLANQLNTGSGTAQQIITYTVTATGTEIALVLAGTVVGTTTVDVVVTRLSRSIVAV